MSSLKHITQCKICGSKEFAMLNEQYDAYHCTKCNVWIEKQCGDPSCSYCTNRPEKPNEQ